MIRNKILELIRYPKFFLMKQLITPSQVCLSLVLLLTTLITASTAASATFRTFPYCDRTFSCGAIQNITYPFTGGARPHYCGLPKFQLTCKNNSITEFTSDSVTYRVLHINQTRKTLTLSASNFSISGFDEFYSDPHEDHCSNCSWVGGTCGFDSKLSLPICICEDVQCPIPRILLHSSDSATPTASQRILQSSDSASGNWGYVQYPRRRILQSSGIASPATSPTIQQSSDIAPPATSPTIQQSSDSAPPAASPAILQSSDPPMASPPILQSTDPAPPAASPAILPPSDSASGGTNLALILGIAIPTGIIVILFAWIMIKKLAQSESSVFCRAKTQNDRNIEACLKNCGSLSPKRYTYSDIKKMTNSFRTKLGQGGFGCVFKGKLENGRFVAVKVLKGLKGGGEEFINEVATISGTSHVNIVTLLGFCFEGRHKALIYEFMPNGSLEKFTRDGDSSAHCQLAWERLYQIAVGIARGLEYLHRGCKTRILHFDIKPHNILLNEDFCPKICDFGHAKLCPEKESIISLLGTRGTIGYIAPEVFSRHFGGVSYKSDVYSYGMMVLEIVGGRKKTHFEDDGTSEIYFPHWVYKRLELDEEFGLHGIMDDEARVFVRKMIIVGLWCIQTNPSDRPSMSRVVEMLEGSLESLQIPPKPFLSSPSRSPVEYVSSTQSQDTVVAES